MRLLEFRTGRLYNLKMRMCWAVIMIPGLLALSDGMPGTGDWRTESRGGYELHYAESDADDIHSYREFIDQGIESVREFFQDSWKGGFAVYIHPNRRSLDDAWRKKMPDFRSECWMIASGVSRRLDLLSMRAWNAEACEHDPADRTKTQRLIAHELFHVYHGQSNASPDFDDVAGLDWFIEGLATYASGQCDDGRIAEVKKGVRDGASPRSLDLFWTGKWRYGLSGSMVMFLDHRYGRDKLRELLKFNKRPELLASLKISEADLIAEWEDWVKRPDERPGSSVAP